MGHRVLWTVELTQPELQGFLNCGTHNWERPGGQQEPKTTQNGQTERDNPSGALSERQER
jgi:hypothetical protein